MTFVLLAAFAAVYALELAYGAPDRIHVMYQLGAGSRSGLEQGELWRLVTATFLHANLVHILMNSYSLYRLGQGTERVLGPTRFALLYMAAGLGGALLSAAVSDRLSVGASGAVWGLMGAQGALVMGAGGIFPPALRAGARRVALQNLFLNVLISFSPGIDWAAHAGGGLVGAAVCLVPAFTRGVPPPRPNAAVIGAPTWMRVAAIGWGAVTVAALVLGIGIGLTRLGAGPRLERAEVGLGGATALLPAGTAAETSAPSERLWNAMIEQGFAVGIGDLGEGWAGAEGEAAVAELLTRPAPESEIVGSVSREGEVWLARFDTGTLDVHRAVRRVGDRAYYVDLGGSGGDAEARASLTRQIAESITLPPP